MADISLNDPWGLSFIALSLLLGGILKGATGAGMPIIAVPVVAAVYDVRLAVILLVVPNFLTNLWQLLRYREQELERGFTASFALSGAVGAGFGTFFLVWLPGTLLNLLMTAVVVIYIAMRLLKPTLQIPIDRARKTAWMAGGSGGLLQGALGISAPVAITFLSAVKLPRPTFIFTVSVYFATMCLTQFSVQVHQGLLTWHIAALGAAALIPMLMGMPVGEWIGRRMGPVMFDRIILAMLACLALKQVWDVFA
ncbi:MAG: sulfite exporter TauE/SafE family protein [Roseibium sp.]|uniref:sulfite exporter TauE/SafE family protein n=1 Tax=Roseibium sp. TaxID=1936156 RepID=UPI00261F17FE|nr:sulfite exporter TauE/SafE family protein [Roseibium sp.]MCV0428905.1 sulfite exporter TauE/SafE family protein [Roseibium sp.]